MAPFCRNCGMDIPGRPRVCPNCGQDQDTPAQEAPTQEPMQGSVQGPMQGPQQGSWFGRGFGGGFGAALGWIVGSCLVLFLVGLLFTGCTLLMAAAGSAGG